MQGARYRPEQGEAQAPPEPRWVHGHVFTDQGVEADPERLKAIQELPKSENVERAQRLNGFVNYLSKFLPRLAEAMEPIRRLTRKEATWKWTVEQQKALEQVKKLATEAPVLSYFDHKCQLDIQCDASQRGLGAALMQRGKPIAYASRSLTETEQRYAQIEKEMADPRCKNSRMTSQDKTDVTSEVQ